MRIGYFIIACSEITYRQFLLRRRAHSLAGTIPMQHHALYTPLLRVAATSPGEWCFLCTSNTLPLPLAFGSGSSCCIAYEWGCAEALTMNGIAPDEAKHDLHHQQFSRCWCQCPRGEKEHIHAWRWPSAWPPVTFPREGTRLSGFFVRKISIYCFWFNAFSGWKVGRMNPWDIPSVFSFRFQKKGGYVACDFFQLVLDQSKNWKRLRLLPSCTIKDIFLQYGMQNSSILNSKVVEKEFIEMELAVGE